MNQFPGWGEAHIEVERDYSESRNQLCKDNVVLLDMRIFYRTNRIKYSDQVSFLARDANVAVTQVESLGNRDDRCWWQLAFLACQISRALAPSWDHTGPTC